MDLVHSPTFGRRCCDSPQFWPWKKLPPAVLLRRLIGYIGMIACRYHPACAYTDGRVATCRFFRWAMFTRSVFGVCMDTSAKSSSSRTSLVTRFRSTPRPLSPSSSSFGGDTAIPGRSRWAAGFSAAFPLGRILFSFLNWILTPGLHQHGLIRRFHAGACRWRPCIRPD